MRDCRGSEIPSVSHVSPDKLTPLITLTGHYNQHLEGFVSKHTSKDQQDMSTYVTAAEVALLMTPNTTPAPGLDSKWVSSLVLTPNHGPGCPDTTLEGPWEQAMTDQRCPPQEQQQRAAAYVPHISLLPRARR